MIARRAPLGYRIEGLGDKRHYVLDDRPLAGHLTVAAAAKLLIDLYLEAGTIGSGLRRWKDQLNSMQPVHDPLLMQRCTRLAVESASGWLEGAAAELQGHIAKAKTVRIDPPNESGKATYRRIPWSEWELSRDRHEPLISPSVARKVLRQLEMNRNRGLARARGEARSKGDGHMPSFTEVAFCAACGQRLRVQTTRASRRPGAPPYRTLRCSGASQAGGPCDQKGLSERKLAYQLHAQLVREAERVAQLMLPAVNQEGLESVDPQLLQQLEEAKRLAEETNIASLRQAVADLEDRIAAQKAAIEEQRELEVGRQMAGKRLAELLPTLGPELATHPASRRQILRAIERIEVLNGDVTQVLLKN